MNNEQNFKQISRRNFLRFAALGAGTLVAVSVTGIASAQVATVAPKPKPVPAAKKLTSTISQNHGHAFVMTLENLKKNGAMSYNIKGTAMHPHNIDVTAQVLAALFAKGVVDIESTNVAGHTHTVRLQIV